jgi:hypothetical protein
MTALTFFSLYSRILIYSVFAALTVAPRYLSAANPSTIPDAPEPSAVPAEPFVTDGFIFSSSRADLYATSFATSLAPGKADAPRYAKYIEPGQKAQPVKWRGKLILSGWEQVQPWSFETQFLAAGWEHLINSNPKTGVNLGGFGEKLWMANVRQNSQAVFSDGVFSSIFHQDPRYYTLGKGGFVRRLYYAASRVVIIRGDNGRQQVNYSEIAGYATAQTLTRYYYPANGCTWDEVWEGYGISLAGAALGNAMHEFSKEIFAPLHHKDRQQVILAR